MSDRPKSELHLKESVCTDGTVPKLLDIIDVVLLKPSPAGHQQENHLNDPSARWVKRGVLAFDELSFLSEDLRTVWTNSDHTATGKWNCMNEAEANGIRLHSPSSGQKTSSCRRTARATRIYGAEAALMSARPVTR